MLEKLFNLKVERLDLVKLGQKTENQFIGVNSGIMNAVRGRDGQKDAGILLDCATLAYEYAPIKLDHHKILIMNTNKRRELADSKYNERRAECESALKQLQKRLDIETLGDLTEETFEKTRKS